MRYALLTIAIFFAVGFDTMTPGENRYVLKIRATNVEERTQVGKLGAAIVQVGADHVVALGGEEDLRVFAKNNLLIESQLLNPFSLNFPPEDDAFHEVNEVNKAFKDLEAKAPQIVDLETIGQSVENRDILSMRITKESILGQKPAVIFMGGHHAREHLSVEMPVKLAQYLVEKYLEQDPLIEMFLEEREIFIIPVVNPDGKIHDVSGGRYKHWRKNRRNNQDGTYGVDLNRNYGYKWATGGSSSRTSSDTYHGHEPFSEPESRAIRDFIVSRPNINVLASFHTFSELILYPWGHSRNSIQNNIDYLTHKKLAELMAQYNKYRPMQASDLYIASGDTMDWSYGERGIYSFTFELDPKDRWSGGFYPGAAKIEPVFQKNLLPCLILIDYAKDPTRIVNEGSPRALFDAIKETQH